MQVTRLFEMLYLLLERGQVTAGELAQRFEVSTRTVYRDLEALSAAGVPVYAVKGRGGGIRLLPGFVLDKSLLTEGEQSGILSALQGFHAAGAVEEEVLDKISALFQKSGPPWIAIDFTGWGEQNDTFELLKEAILEKRVVRFQYFGTNGKKTRRRVEPLQLRFKSRTWYLVAHCRDREEQRFFKLSRIKNPSLTGEGFDRVLEPESPDSTGQDWATPENTRYLLEIHPSQAFRVFDEYPEEQVRVGENGCFLVEAAFPLDSWAVGHFLSYGGSLRVLEPPEAREAVRRQAEEILKQNQI